jgi:tetratricopeptide (TPR) repeat protein
VRGTEAELREAVKLCNGHALSLTLLATLLQTYSRSLSVLLHESEYTQLWEERMAQNLLDRIFINLPEQSRQLLCAFSVYREGVPVDAAQAVMPNITKVQALSILGTLLEQHLIQPQVSSGYYELHPIIATYARHHFVVNDEAADKQARQAAHAKAAHYYLQLATAHCPTHDKRRHLSDVQPLIEAVWQCTQAGQVQEAYALMEREELFGDLRLWGENTLLLDLCQLLLTANGQFTPPQQALLYSYLASTLSTLGQKPKALEYYEQALRIWREVGDRAGEGTTLNSLGAVYDALGQKSKALEYYEQALQISKEVGAHAGEGITLHNIGIIFSGQRRDEVALACILLAKTLFEQVQSSAYVDNEVQWINDFRRRMGEKQYASLLAQVEPRAEQIVAEALQKGL